MSDSPTTPPDVAACEAYEAEYERQAFVAEVETIITEHPGWPTLQLVLERVNYRLKTGGALIVRHRSDPSDPLSTAGVCVEYGDASAQTMKDVAAEAQIKCGVGLLGKAWDALYPKVWGEKEAKKLTRKCPLLRKLAPRVRNVLVAPIYRERDAAGLSVEPNRPSRPLRAEERCPILAYLCLFNKAAKRPDRPVEYRQFEEEDTKLATALCRSIAVSLRYERLVESATLSIVEALDRRDPRDAEHSRRVAEHMQSIAKMLFLSGQWGEEFMFGEVRRSWYVGILHDVGKIGAPDSLLGGRGDVQTETGHRRIHPHSSAAIVEQIEGLGPKIAQAITQHHEWFRGQRGYLYKVQGRRMDPLARILAVADIYDSMRRSRGTWRGFSKFAAYAQLLRLRGNRLDPGVVDAFLKTDEFNDPHTTSSSARIQKGSVLATKLARPRNKFLTPQYACQILHNEMGGNPGCDYKECPSFEDMLNKVRISIKELHKGLGLPERAQEAELAFLHIRWTDDGEVPAPVYEALDAQAGKRQVLPIALEGGVGILAPRCPRADAYTLAQEFHEAVAKVYEKNKKLTRPGARGEEPVIGIAYIPHADIIGCRCIVGSSLIASLHALRLSEAPGAIAFFERSQLPGLAE